MNRVDKLRRSVFWALLLVTVLLQTGCVQNTAFRTEADEILIKGAELEIPYDIAFIEFDDQGQYQNPSQRDLVLEQLAEISDSSDTIVVTYVHGWTHNAKQGDCDVAEFLGLLQQLGDIEQFKENGRKVLGIYIGWRGSAIDSDLLEWTTFLDRKNAALRAATSDVVELFSALHHWRDRKWKEYSWIKKNPSRLIMVGHSLGASLVYSAIYQVMIDNFREAQTLSGSGIVDQNHIVQGFGDLVVLVNPALEAASVQTLWRMQHEVIRAADQNRKKGVVGFSIRQQPELVVLGSESDYATKIAFAVSQSVGSVFETYRYNHERNDLDGAVNFPPEEQFQADTTAIGHYRPYRTHRLMKNETARDERIDMADEGKGEADEIRRCEQGIRKPGALTSLVRQVHNREEDPVCFPYWFVAVDKALMDGHSANLGSNDEIKDFIEKVVLSKLDNKFLNEKYRNRVTRTVYGVPKTGQEHCYDTTGQLASCADTGQDGEFKSGISHPVPRFEAMESGVIKDNLTGLVWLKEVDCEVLNPDEAGSAWPVKVEEIQQLESGQCGLNDLSRAGDWRLPNRNELNSLFYLGEKHPILSLTGEEVMAKRIWSSTSEQKSEGKKAWMADLEQGVMAAVDKIGQKGYLWAVRGAVPSRGE
ncbi:MAG: DUF1566 domain-containing protein [Gammaproteobacteria bacterium]|nr:DUF1566 domain-containing protein [Gammaproteobacteria bacterium]MBT3719566.1 DUF1566 domain-containing protein [Gammaproteobacteria bacterium]MBT3844914.1 DUF1566 domain-containing protein [Gammaproteobacteria bacterium]MBT3893901.1 DUF1566 domain-containing protein [Gammaproteobacteria bacterium]MBT4301403.1 DUF1566 domain-containing protein [Gammaproteobacteria bacterium]